MVAITQALDTEATTMITSWVDEGRVFCVFVGSMNLMLIWAPVICV